MIQVLGKLSCGGCGEEKHTIWAAKDADGDTVLISTCTECSSNSIIRFPKPRNGLEILWPSNADESMKDGDGCLSGVSKSLL